MARIESGKEKETLASLDDLYSSFNPGFTFDYQFMDVEYAKMYALIGSLTNLDLRAIEKLKAGDLSLAEAIGTHP